MSGDTRELWPTSGVQEYLGYGSTAAARVWLRRYGILPVTDEQGRVLRDPGTDEKIYDAELVRAKRETRPRPNYRRTYHGQGSEEIGRRH